jgi:hypothetical protein
MGPTPPDRIAMTFGEHLSAALNHLASTNLSGDDLQSMKVFMVSVDQVVKQKRQQQQGQLLPEEEGPAPAGADMGEGEDVMSGQGEPIETEF